MAAAQRSTCSRVGRAWVGMERHKLGAAEQPLQAAVRCAMHDVHIIIVQRPLQPKQALLDGSTVAAAGALQHCRGASTLELGKCGVPLQPLRLLLEHGRVDG